LGVLLCVRLWNDLGVSALCSPLVLLRRTRARTIQAKEAEAAAAEAEAQKVRTGVLRQIPRPTQIEGARSQMKLYGSLTATRAPERVAVRDHSTPELCAWQSKQARTWFAIRRVASERSCNTLPRLLLFAVAIALTARNFTTAASDRTLASVDVLYVGRIPRARTSVSVHICGHKGMRIEQAVDNFNTHRSLLRLAHELSQQTSKTEQTASVIPHSDQLSRKGRCPSADLLRSSEGRQ